VIIGGVAASLHGGSRVTFDLDVVPSLAPTSRQAAVDLLWSSGARPRIPEPLERIRDVAWIRKWRQDQGMLAVNVRAPDGSTEVDLLAGESDGFEELRQRAIRVAVDVPGLLRDQRRRDHTDLPEACTARAPPLI
jgi:hypothetical protein